MELTVVPYSMSCSKLVLTGVKCYSAPPDTPRRERSDTAESMGSIEDERRAYHQKRLNISVSCLTFCHFFFPSSFFTFPSSFFTFLTLFFPFISSFQFLLVSS